MHKLPIKYKINLLHHHSKYHNNIWMLRKRSQILRWLLVLLKSGKWWIACYLIIHLFLPFNICNAVLFWKLTTHWARSKRSVCIYIYSHIDSNRSCMRGSTNWLNYPKHRWTTKFNSNLMTKVNYTGNRLIKIAKCESTKEKNL